MFLLPRKYVVGLIKLCSPASFSLLPHLLANICSGILFHSWFLVWWADNKFPFLVGGAFRVEAVFGVGLLSDYVAVSAADRRGQCSWVVYVPMAGKIPSQESHFLKEFGLCLFVSNKIRGDVPLSNFQNSIFDFLLDFYSLEISW